MSDYGPLKGERSKAFSAFCAYRNTAPGKRSLTAVAQTLQEQHASGHGQSCHKDQLESWAERYTWALRALEWDQLLDKHLRSRLQEQEQRVGAHCLAQVEVAITTTMRPILAAARVWSDPGRESELNALSALDVLRLGLQAVSVLPQLQTAERLCRGEHV